MILLSLAMIILILLMLVFSSLIVHVILKSRIKRKYIIGVSLCLLALLYISYTKVRYTYIIPLVHFVFQPDDYNDPLIVDDFLFHKKGYSKIYSLPYKYPQIHAVKIISEEMGLSKFNGSAGKLKAQFFYEDRLLFEKVVTSLNENKYLVEFAMPLNNKYKKDIELKLTIIEPFKELVELNKPLPVEIGIISN